MTTFNNDILRRQFILRYGHYLSDGLVEELVTGLADMFDKETYDQYLNTVMSEVITPHREADLNDLMEANMQSVYMDIAKVRELSSNLVGFRTAFSIGELESIWKEVVTEVTPNFEQLYTETEVAA